MIFLTVTGSFAAAVIYDRREKKRVQQKWSNLVAHISQEALPVEQMRRKLTVFLAAPPGDGLRVARDYFKEYVKPVLVSAAVDYEVIEGRKEGDIRAGLAEKIRKQRRKAGEPTAAIEEPSVQTAIAETRERLGITDEPGPKGDLIIGRHTWKEYIRGLHEGWLGPIDPPQPPSEPVPIDTESMRDPADPPTASSSEHGDEPTPVIEEEDDKKKAQGKDEEPSKPAGPTPAYIFPADYSSRALAVSIPATFEGSTPVPFPHLLGFLNTPIRIYRYLNQRHLADQVGREVAALVLASYSRPYRDGAYSADSDLGSLHHGFASEASPTSTSTDPFYSSSELHEQQTLLEHEEGEWHKSIRKQGATLKAEKEQAQTSPSLSPTKTKITEREWLDDVVLDPRIAVRMRRYELSPEEESRAKRIAEGQEWVIGEEKPRHIPFWERIWIKYGYGEDPEVAKRKPIWGNIDGEDGE